MVIQLNKTANFPLLVKYMRQDETVNLAFDRCKLMALGQICQLLFTILQKSVPGTCPFMIDETSEWLI